MPGQETTEVLTRPGEANAGAQPASSPAPQTSPSLLGAGLLLTGRFRLVRHIASGGMGEVFEAFDEVLRVRVALKTFRRGEGSAAERTRLEREVRLSRRVSHPNVLRVFEFFAGDEAAPPFLTMELLEGETLSAHLRASGRLPPEEALPVIRQLVAGLAAAHAEGVVHRDLKASNVFVARPLESAGVPRVVVADFGIARALVRDAAENAETATGFPVGSPHSMAPEQITSGAIDERTDVYALGVLIFQMVTGEFPFVGETPLATAVMRLHHAAPTARSRVATLPVRWDRTIQACLQRDPRRRPGTVQSVLEALEGQAPRRPGWRWAALLALALATATVPVSLHLRARGVAPARTARRSIAVLPFRLQPAVPSTAWVSEAVGEILAAELGAGDKLRVLDRGSVARLRQASSEGSPGPGGADDLERLRSLVGADVAVAGTLTGGAHPDAELRLDVLARDTATGQTLAILSETATVATLPTLVGRAGSRLRNLLGGGELSPGEVIGLQTTRPRTQAALQSFAEGLRFREQRQLERARTGFEQSMRQDATFLPSRLALVETLLDLGRLDAARLMAREALALAEQLPGDWRSRAEALLRRSEHDDAGAAAIYQRLLEAHPDSVEEALRYAQTAPAASAVSVIAAMRHRPGPTGQDLRLDLQEAIGRLDLSEPAKALDVLGPAEARARALGAPHLLARTRLLQAQTLLILKGQSTEAEAALKEAEAILRNASADDELERVLVHQGFVEARKGQMAAAIAKFEESARLEEALGNFAEAHAALSYLAGQQARTGDLRSALATVRRVEHDMELAADGGFPMELAELGNIEFLGGRLAGARRWFDRARQQSEAGDGPPAYTLGLYLGVLQREAGHPAEARQALLSVRSDSFLGLDAASYLAMLDCEEGHPQDGLARLRATDGSRGTTPLASQAFAAAVEARCALRANDRGTAERLARSALENARRSSALNARVQALLVLVELEAQDSGEGPAMTELRSLAEVTERQGAKRSELDARLGLATAMAHPDPRRAHRDAAALADEARALGFVRVERLARGLLAALD